MISKELSDGSEGSERARKVLRGLSEGWAPSHGIPLCFGDWRFHGRFHARRHGRGHMAADYRGFLLAFWPPGGSRQFHSRFHGSGDLISDGSGHTEQFLELGKNL